MARSGPFTGWTRTPAAWWYWPGQLSAAKLAGRVQKDYYAVVPGTYTGSGTVDAPIAHCPDSTVKRCVDPAGVRAVTHWKALGQ